MQLVAYGAQDIYLTGNPQITFFKVVYRRHTNFSMELIQQVVEGTSTIKDGVSGSQGYVTISRNGDLIYDMYVAMKDGAPVGNGDHIIDQVDLEIGGQLIDRHTLEWNQIWWELTTPASKEIALRTMLGRSRKVHSRSPGQHIQAAVFVPLQFGFCLNPGLALPLIALQYHEVKLKFKWGDDWSYSTGTGEGTCEVWGNYIYLDTDERRRFAQVSHEYLITQVQVINEHSGSTSFTSTGSQLSLDLTFNHPVKELIWSYPGSFFTDVSLKLNGHQRFAKQPEEYFKLTQPYKYHTKVHHETIVDTNTHIITGVTKFRNTEHTRSTIKGLTGAKWTKNHVAIDRGSGNFPYDMYIHTDAAGLGMIKRGSMLRLTNASGNLITQGLVTSNPHNPKKGHKFHDFTTFGFRSYGTAGPSYPNDNDTVALTVTYSHQPHDAGGITNFTNSLGVYSFALKPEEHQPSGTCNFSRIDSAILEGNYCSIHDSDGSNGDDETINIYAVNYNVLRIMSGMGGLAYSN